jgi:pyrroline-5-carboxylate reductase
MRRALLPLLAMSNPSIGFLGAGKMATALAQGFLKAGLVDAGRLFASDVVPAAALAFSNTTGGRSLPSNREVASSADVLVVAVKPDQVAGVLHDIRDVLDSQRHRILSIAAGVSIASLEAAAPGQRVIRVMPNTPALVGASASAYALGSAATRDDGALAQRLFGSVGLALQVKERLLDAVTGLSGSGPAYGFLMIEALADGGVAAGLPRDIAQRLAAQTLLGAAQLVLETGQHPGALKDAVCSPGGTTIEGVHELEKGGVRAALIAAVRSAAEKSRRLGQS